MEVDDPHPSQRPSESKRKQTIVDENGFEQEVEKEEERSVMDPEHGDYRYPCIASILIKLYDPNKPSNKEYYFAPNIFSRISIRESENGLSTVCNMVKALGKYNEERENG